MSSPRRSTETPAFLMELTRKKKPRKRAFKACALCRSRKAKCEFETPSDSGVIPCLRCKKESAECQFFPTRRGGNYGNGYTVRYARKLREQEQRQAEMAINTGRKSSVSQSSLAEDSQNRDSPPVDAEHLTEAPLRNPSDALEILARTSPRSRPSSSVSEEDRDASQGIQGEKRNSTPLDQAERATFNSNVPPPGPETHIDNDNDIARDSEAMSKINSFPLIRAKLLNLTQLRTYVSIYISRHNHYLPIIPEYRLPNSDHRLAQFAAEEPFLLMVIVVIASRYEKESVHDSLWKFTRCHLSGITYGGLPTLGVVEALLLLSENLPRLPTVVGPERHRMEAFMSWNLVGLAVRFSYFMGLDQKTMLPAADVHDEKTSRERLVWTYCYIFDRQVSIRLGKAFWSRGPGLCFESTPFINMDIRREAHHNFPSLVSGEYSMSTDGRLENPPADDGQRGISIDENAILVQAYVELTQILTNIHDTLYPSRERTIALVRVGEYYRILDEFALTFMGFSSSWKHKYRWRNFPLNETVWATFHYTKLYAFSFAFQAHVQRATTKSKERITDEDAGVKFASIIFPRGVAACPDAKFILEAINSATKLLKICVNDLFDGGALESLPSRFYGYFSYAAVFLIKVVVTGAVVTDERESILTLVSRTINAFQLAASEVDEQHLGVRSARQLKTLMQSLNLSLPKDSDMEAPGPGTDNKFAGSGKHDAPQQQHQGPQQTPLYPSASDDTSTPTWFDELDTFQMDDLMFGPTTNPYYEPEALQMYGSVFGTTMMSFDGRPLAGTATQELAQMLSMDIDSNVWLPFLQGDSISDVVM